MSRLAFLLEPIEFSEGTLPLLPIHSGTQFGYVADADSIRRVDGNYDTVLVPTHHWSAQELDDNIVRLLLLSATANPLNLAGLGDITHIFWASNRWIRVMLVSPKVGRKLRVMPKIEIIESDLISDNRILCVGRPDLVGYVVRQGARVGLLAHDKRGVLGIQLFNEP